eukprot:10833418-Heterocapsa_arctica.AAC.1
MFSAPVGQWQEHDREEVQRGTEGVKGRGFSPNRREEQAWEWQAGHEDLNPEGEAIPGGVQEEEPEFDQEQEDYFEEMIAGCWNSSTK